MAPQRSSSLWLSSSELVALHYFLFHIQCWILPWADQAADEPLLLTLCLEDGWHPWGPAESCQRARNEGQHVQGKPVALMTRCRLSQLWKEPAECPTYPGKKWAQSAVSGSMHRLGRGTMKCWFASRWWRQKTNNSRKIEDLWRWKWVKKLWELSLGTSRASWGRASCDVLWGSVAIS